MNTELKSLWHEYKYDVYYFFTWVITCIIVFDVPINIFSWRYWVLIGSTLIYRLIGYKEGQLKTAKLILEHKTDININVKDERFEPSVCELKNIQNGLYFTLLNDEHQTKYLKCNNVNIGSSKCWNFDTKELCLINDDAQCIMYITNTVYTPVGKIKENK